MLYRIQAAKDGTLSNMAMTLKEQQALIKTEDRQSRNPEEKDFTEVINEQVCRLGAAKVTDDTVIVVEPGDIWKKCARKMKLLGKAYDGSEREVGNGYHLSKIVAVDIESTRVIPLHGEVYAYDAVKSDYMEVLHAIGLVESHIGDKGIHAIDRGETVE